MTFVCPLSQDSTSRNILECACSAIW